MGIIKPDILDIAVYTNGVYRFGSPFDKSAGFFPCFYASKSFTGEDPSRRVKWRTMVMHGEGTLWLNVYVDNVMILSQQQMVMTEMPTQERLVNMPRGKSTGYALRYEYQLSTGHVRFTEIFYEDVLSDVN